ncbi:DUF2269 family protein [Fictibacillus phosphorivorans]|uniref:DUF2269 family protein n=1 Tax=Fictibacillus phosphorivorans TaxID=1221500 RepID=UPI00203AC35C|nr:DUF2269 family protein [Fictibacillus phosphorivorans]MCM3719001.1 DUF2269 family protein [Fictibacillus phosphorivorans]MCM3776623.1 DUF2269 family protein [Fictibacillus phosphorivorans]
MKKSSPKKLTRKNWWLIFHLISTVLFVGGSFTQWVLMISALTANSAEVLRVSHHFMHIVDLSLIIPGLLGVIITGVFLSLRTHWGFVKHYWIIAKEIITLITLGIGSVLNIWVQSSIQITKAKGLDALTDPVYLHDRNMLIISAIIQTSLLLFVIVISVLKPWGKRKQQKQTKALSQNG